MGEDLMDWLRDNAVNDYSRGYLYQQALDEIESLRQRITELEAVIKSHGIPVKTYTNGQAHYCTGIYDAKEEV